MCSFNAHQRRPGLREQVHRDRHPQEASGASTASSRATTRRSPRCGPARRRTPDTRPVRPRRRRRRPGRGAPGAERRHRLGDGQHEHPRLRQAAARAAPDLDAADRRRRAPHPAREVPRRAVRAPVRRRRQGEGPEQLPQPADRAAARTGAARSMVLLKNDGDTLPLDPNKKTAVIGPLGDERHDMLGPWWGRGDDADAVTVLRRHQGAGPEHDVHAGLHADQPRAAAVRPGAATAVERRLRRGDGRRQAGRPGRARPRRDARDERRGRGAHRRSTCPGEQQELIDAIKADRQAVRGRAVQRPPADARRGRRRARPRSSRPGSRASRPATRSPTCSSARSTPAASCRCRSRSGVGQVPIYYNHEPTGRPCDVTQKYNSRYRDLPTCDAAVRVRLRPQLHDVRDLEPAAELAARLAPRERDRHRSTSTNTGAVTGDDVVQLYIHDPVASISQPVRRLRGFERVTLDARASRRRCVHARRARLRLLRQPREVRRRARPDRRRTPATARARRSRSR